MKIFKNIAFHRWAKDIKLTDMDLVQTINEMSEGNVDAALGGNIYKKRVPLQGRGKRGGARTIIAFKHKDSAFFVYGFAKNKRANITDKDLEALKKLAKLLFSYDSKQLQKAVKQGELIEVVQ